MKMLLWLLKIPDFELFSIELELQTRAIRNVVYSITLATN